MKREKGGDLEIIFRMFEGVKGGTKELKGVKGEKRDKQLKTLFPLLNSLIPLSTLYR